MLLQIALHVEMFPCLLDLGVIRPNDLVGAHPAHLVSPDPTVVLFALPKFRGLLAFPRLQDVLKAG